MTELQKLSEARAAEYVDSMWTNFPQRGAAIASYLDGVAWGINYALTFTGLLPDTAQTSQSEFQTHPQPDPPEPQP